MGGHDFSAIMLLSVFELNLHILPSTALPVLKQKSRELLQQSGTHKSPLRVSIHW